MTLQETKIYSATRGPQGKVIKENELSEAEAIAAYRADGDVVVCGEDRNATRPVAQRIAAAAGKYKRQDPHKRAGSFSLPHFQPDPRPPEGHVFYETDKKKAFANP